jgi:hypothetical protein
MIATMMAAMVMVSSMVTAAAFSTATIGAAAPEARWASGAAAHRFHHQHQDDQDDDAEGDQDDPRDCRIVGVGLSEQDRAGNEASRGESRSASGQTRLRDDPRLVEADALVTLLAAKADGHGRPDIGGRALAEEARVAVECALVPVGEFPVFRRATLARAVVKRLSEHLRAEFAPIRFRIEQVQMPRLVDGIGGRDRMSSAHGEEEETAILLEDARGECGGPAVFVREPGREMECGVRRVEAELSELGPQRIGECRRFVEGGGCLSTAAFLFFAASLVPVLERFVCIHTFVSAKDRFRWDR